jgi:hypothetical protein
MKMIYANPEMNIRTFKQEHISTDENGAYTNASQYTSNQINVAELLGNAAQKASYIFNYE